MNADVLFTSDLHGSVTHYREMLDLARERRVRAILLGGDLALHGPIPLQRTFFRDFFLTLLRDYFAEEGSADVWWIMGNDDWSANVPLLEEAGVPRLKHVHGRVVPFLDGWSLAGLACIPASPFALKDWERWEEGLGPAARLQGFRSDRTGGSHPFNFLEREKDESLVAEFAELERHWPADGSRTLCMFHGPPYGTACDQLHGHVHVGSRVTRDFLERRSPPLSLHGHIHEAPIVSGQFWDRVGSTVCVNPGQSPGKPLAAVTFSMKDPVGTLDHTLEGAVR